MNEWIYGGRLPSEPEIRQAPPVELTRREPSLQGLQAQMGTWAATGLFGLGGGRYYTTGIGEFHIAAPAESFQLQKRPIDPLLFCHLGDNQYYLVHKWGSDLSIWRASRRYFSRTFTWAHILTLLGMMWYAGFSAYTRNSVDGAMAQFFSWFTLAVFVTFAGNSLAARFRNNVTTDHNWNRPYTD